MATYYTDFREYRRGRIPGDFTERWKTGSSARVEGAYCDLPSRNSLVLTGGFGTQRVGLSWNVADIGSYANQQILGCFRSTQRGNSGAEVYTTVLVLRGAGTASAPTCYRALIDITTGAVVIQKLVSGTATTLGTGAGKSVRLGTFYWVRFEVTGTTVRARLWADGDTEPVSWDASATDSAITAAGWSGLHLFYSDETWYCYYLSIGTNGDTAPSESAADEIMDSWIAEPDEEIEITIKLEYFDPSDNTIKEIWYSNYGRVTGSDDYPPSTVFEPLLIDPGSLSSSLEADAYFGGSVTVSRSPIILDNKPLTTASAGPHDSWIALSFSGRPVGIRIGKRWSVRPSTLSEGILTQHRRFELLGCASVSGEPIIDSERTTINIGPPLTALRDTIPSRRNVGISTGVNILSSSGWISIPSSASYDLASYTIYCRLYLPSSGVSGSGVSTISKRENGSFQRTWGLFLFQSSHASFPNQFQLSVHDSGGTNIISSLYDLTSYLGSWVDIVCGVNGNDRWYVLINSASVLSGTLSSKPLANSGIGVELLRSSVGLTLCDHRIEKFVNEDTAISRFAALRSPDTITISMHRCNDASGNTVTDYATLANNGTLQGTDGVDRAWVATYLGAVELAGISMPISGGVLYHGPCQPIDSVREIFRFNDRAKTSGSSLQIRAKGLLLTGGGTNYSEPTLGPGTADIVGASDQPITFGLVASASPSNQAIQIPQLLRDDLISRGALSVKSLDSGSFDGLRKTIPAPGGFYASEPPAISDLLTSLLGPLGAYYDLDSSGRVYVGCLQPAANPGPWGQRNVLEFLGYQDKGATISYNSAYNLTQTTDHFSLLVIAKCYSNTVDPSTSGSFTYFPTGMTLIDGCGTSATGYYLGIDGRDGCVIFGAPGVTFGGATFLKVNYQIPPNRWFAVAAERTGSSCDVNVYIFKPTATLGDIESNPFVNGTPTGSLSANSNIPVRIGHGPFGSFVGSIMLAVGSSAEKSLTFSITSSFYRMSKPSFASGTDRFYIDFGDGSGDLVTDTAQSKTGRIEGARWAPRAILDFRLAAVPTLSDVHRPVPAWRVDNRYKPNLQPISGADVAAGVSASDRIALANPYISEPVSVQSTKTNYLDSRDLALMSYVLSSADSNFSASLIKSRISTDRRLADILGWYREALKLCIGDEVLVYHDRYGLSSGKSMRVPAITKKLVEMLVDIGLWG